MEGRCTVGELIRQARLASPLAGIAGGRATWLIDTQGVGRGCIGVVAQQWDQPQFLIPAETTVDQLFHDQDATVFFRYWGQSSPEAVLEALKSGAALPSRLAPLD